MALAVLLIESAVFFTAFFVLLHTVDASVSGAMARVNQPVAALVLAGCCIGSLYYSELYDLKKVRSFWTCLARVSRACAVAVLPIGLLLYAVLPSGTQTWIAVLTASAIAVTTVVVSRSIWLHVMQSRPFTEQVLVLGKTPLARALIAELQTRPAYRVLDMLPGGFSRTMKADDDVMPGRSSRHQLAELRPTRIVVALSERRGRLPVDLLLDAKRQGIVVEDGIQLYERLTGKLAIETLQPSHLIFAPEFGTCTAHNCFSRSLSVLVAVVGVVVCAPLLLMIAALVKLDSTGPVLFVQDRIGKDGRRFPLMKFRTMKPLEARASEWVKDNGDRITRVGRWLRKFRLDELPQLFNILAGHMNLVGPRPHPASNYDLFMANIPFYGFRSLVRPGITGWAQVRYGYANNLEEETEKMRYDLYYIKHRSLGMDLEILLQTAKVVGLGRDCKMDSHLPIAEPLLNERTDAA
jgi:exopolysaccharide biosynthesis polyprenyl glycosylphosphotransferase